MSNIAARSVAGVGGAAVTAGLLGLFIAAFHVFAVVEPAGVDLVLGGAVFAPALLLLAGLSRMEGSVAVKGLAAVVVLVLAPIWDLTESVSVGYSGTVALALALFALAGPTRSGPAALGALLIFAGAAVAGCSFTAGTDYIELDVTLGWALIGAGALCFRVHPWIGVAAAVIGGAASVFVAALNLYAETYVSAGEAELFLEFVAEQVSRPSVVTLAVFAGAATALRGLLRGESAQGATAWVAGALAVWIGLGFGALGDGLSWLLSWIPDFELIAPLPPPSPPPPGATIPLLTAPPPSELDQISFQTVAPRVFSQVVEENIVIVGSVVGVGSWPGAPLLLAVGAALIGFAARSRWGLSILAVLGLAALDQGVSAAGDYPNWYGLTVDVAPWLAAPLYAWLGARAAPSANAYLAGTTRAIVKSAPETPAAQLPPFDAKRRMGWRSFIELSQRLRNDPQALKQAALDPSFSPFAFKLAETFYAGLPAAIFGLALTIIDTAGPFFAAGFSRESFANAVYNAGEGATSSIVEAYVLPMLFFVIAATASWPLTSFRTPRAPRGAGRRLYLTFDGAIGLWSQMAASIGVAMGTASLERFASSGSDADFLGWIFAVIGGVLFVPASLMLFYINVVRLPVRVAKALGSTTWWELALRLIGHYVVATLAFAVLSSVLNGLLVGVQLLLVEGVRAAFSY